MGANSHALYKKVIDDQVLNVDGGGGGGRGMLFCLFINNFLGWTFVIKYMACGYVCPQLVITVRYRGNRSLSKRRGGHQRPGFLVINGLCLVLFILLFYQVKNRLTIFK